MTSRDEIKKKIEDLQKQLSEQDNDATDLIEKFMKGFDGQRLLKQHTLNSFGVWSVHGEDPNCDMGGSHSQPLLGFYEGMLDTVIRLAVQLPKFWNWGAGGSITKITITKVE